MLLRSVSAPFSEVDAVVKRLLSLSFEDRTVLLGLSPKGDERLDSVPAAKPNLAACCSLALWSAVSISDHISKTPDYDINAVIGDVKSKDTYLLPC